MYTAQRNGLLKSFFYYERNILSNILTYCVNRIRRTNRMCIKIQTTRAAAYKHLMLFIQKFESKHIHLCIHTFMHINRRGFDDAKLTTLQIPMQIIGTPTWQFLSWYKHKQILLYESNHVHNKAMPLYHRYMHSPPYCIVRTADSIFICLRYFITCNSLIRRNQTSFFSNYTANFSSKRGLFRWEQKRRWKCSPKTFCQ